MNSPDGDPLAAIVVCYNGSLEAGEKVLRPLRTFGPPVADAVAPTPYCKAQTFFDEAFVRGRRYYFKSNFARNISEEAIATLVKHFATAPSPMSMLYFQQLGKAANRVGATETAFSHRDALCEWGCDAVWLDPAQDAANISWVRGWQTRCARSRPAATMSTISASRPKRGRIASRPPSAQITIGSWF